MYLPMPERQKPRGICERPRPRLQARLFVAFDSVEVMIETVQNELKSYVLLTVVDKSLGPFLTGIEGEVFWGT
jgi:hypothetical protein